MEIYEHDVGHMTKIDAKPMYGKALKKPSQEPVDL